MKKKKALIIAYNDLNNSGVPNVIFQIVSSLSEDYEFDIVIFEDNDYYYKKLSKLGIKPNLIKFETKTKSGKCKGIVYHLISFPKLMYKQSIKLMSKQKYDVIHSFKENYSWSFLKAAKMNGINKRIVHSNINNNRNKNIAFKLLDNFNKRKTLHYATALVGVSALCCKNSFGNRQWTVLHNSFDEKRFNNTVTYDGDINSLTLVQIGSFNQNKNQLFSLQIAKILKQRNKDFKLMFFGKETEIGYQKKMENFILESNLSKNVQIINDCKNIVEAYRVAKYVLIPSKTEGASIVAIEAQACGIPVFASSSIPLDMNVGGIKFIDIKKSANDWADLLVFKDSNKYSREYYDMSEFSMREFKNKLQKLYNF